MKCILVLFEFFVPVPLFAQNANAFSWYLNMEKYWWYRYRLINDFMIVGSNMGESIPANERQLAISLDGGGH